MTAAREFDAYARSYDLLYGDKDYSAEAAFVHRQLQRWAPGASRLLELGCGTGGHALPLAGLGYQVLGIDVSPAMLARAEQRRTDPPALQAGRLRFQQGDMRNLRLDERFDAVVSLFHVMSYQTSDDDLAAALAGAARQLRPGGVLLFDFWYGPAVLQDPPAVRVKRAGDTQVQVTRLAEPRLHTSSNTVDVNYHLFVEERQSGRIEQVRETHTLRYWFWPELQRHMVAAGLQSLGLWAWLTEEQAGPQHWLAYTACRSVEAAAQA